MKTISSIILSLLVTVLSSLAEWRDGDIILQETAGQQAEVVKLATNSQWTHIGVVVLHNGEPYVLEAVQPVRVTTLKNFINRSYKGNYQVMRLKDSSPITQQSLAKARKWAEQQIGKNYDSLFQWSDSHLYCSELVWKIYSTANIELCKPKLLREYDLSHPKVKSMIKKRYGSESRLPLDEKVVAPSDIAKSTLLEIIMISSTKK